MRWSGGSRRKEGRADGSFFGRFLVQYQTSPFVSGMDFIAKKIGISVGRTATMILDRMGTQRLPHRPIFRAVAVAIQWVHGLVDPSQIQSTQTMFRQTQTAG